MFVNQLNTLTFWMISVFNREYSRLPYISLEQQTYLQWVQMVEQDRRIQPHSHRQLQGNITHRGALSARPYSHPFLGCWTSRVIVSPLEKGSRVRLELIGWWSVRALMTSPLPPPPELEMLPWGDGAVGDDKWNSTSKLINSQKQ